MGRNLWREFYEIRQRTRQHPGDTERRHNSGLPWEDCFWYLDKRLRDRWICSGWVCSSGKICFSTYFQNFSTPITLTRLWFVNIFLFYPYCCISSLDLLASSSMQHPHTANNTPQMCVLEDLLITQRQLPERSFCPTWRFQRCIWIAWIHHCASQFWKQRGTLHRSSIFDGIMATRPHTVFLKNSMIIFYSFSSLCITHNKPTTILSFSLIILSIPPKKFLFFKICFRFQDYRTPYPAPANFTWCSGTCTRSLICTCELFMLELPTKPSIFYTITFLLILYGIISHHLLLILTILSPHIRMIEFKLSFERISKLIK